MLINGIVVALLSVIFLLLFVVIEWSMQLVLQRKTLRARLKEAEHLHFIPINVQAA